MSERKPIYLCLAHLSGEGLEQKYVKEAFDTNWVVPMGPNVNAFEQSLADFTILIATEQNLIVRSSVSLLVQLQFTLPLSPLVYSLVMRSACNPSPSVRHLTLSHILAPNLCSSTLSVRHGIWISNSSKRP